MIVQECNTLETHCVMVEWWSPLTVPLVNTWGNSLNHCYKQIIKTLLLTRHWQISLNAYQLIRTFQIFQSDNCLLKFLKSFSYLPQSSSINFLSEKMNLWFKQIVIFVLENSVMTTNQTFFIMMFTIMQCLNSLIIKHL